MSRKRYILFALVVASLLTCCAPDPFSTEAPQLVVEGWIDAGGHPEVYLTTSVPFSTHATESYDMSSHLVRAALVKVTDVTTGEEAVLTGRYLKNGYLPYQYVTTHLTGQEGHSYRLTVEVEGTAYRATAITTIPPVSAMRYEATPHPTADTLWQLSGVTGGTATADVSVKENIAHGGTATADIFIPTKKNVRRGRATGAVGYKFFAMVRGTDTYPLSCYMGLYTLENAEGGGKLPVYNVHRMDRKHFSPYYSYADTLVVKCCAIDSASYRFWKSYEETVSLSRSPYFSYSANLQGNVSGALGYWCGYGATYNLITPPVR